MESALFLWIGQYLKEILSVVATVVGWSVKELLKPRARLVRSFRYDNNVLINDVALDDKGAVVKDKQGQVVSVKKLVHIAEVSITNLGRETATNVLVTFNFKPQHFNIAPPRHYSEETAPDGRQTIKLGSLPPKDRVLLLVMSVASEIPAITLTQCDECVAVDIREEFRERIAPWRRYLDGFLRWAGVAATVYALISLLSIAVK